MEKPEIELDEKSMKDKAKRKSMRLLIDKLAQEAIEDMDLQSVPALQELWDSEYFIHLVIEDQKIHYTKSSLYMDIQTALTAIMMMMMDFKDYGAREEDITQIPDYGTARYYWIYQLNGMLTRTLDDYQERAQQHVKSKWNGTEYYINFCLNNIQFPISYDDMFDTLEEMTLTHINNELRDVAI
jgi:hypothetical protein